MVFTVVPTLTEIGTMAVVLATIRKPILLAILGAAMLGYGLAFALGVMRIAGPARAAAVTRTDAHASMTDSLLNTETVKCFGAAVGERFDSAMQTAEREWADLFQHLAANGIVATTIFCATLAASAFVAARAVLQRELTLGDFVGQSLRAPDRTADRPDRSCVPRSDQGIHFLEQQIELLELGAEGHAEGLFLVLKKDRSYGLIG